MASSGPSFELAAGAARHLRAALDEGAGALAIDSALVGVVDSIVRAGLAEWCLLEVADEGTREPRLVACAHLDPAQVARARAAHGRGPLAEALGWKESHATNLATRGRELGVLTIAGTAGPLGEGAIEQAGVLAGLMAGALETAYLVAERDEMLSVVSHDLRNPLGVILLVVDLLRGSELPDELRTQMSRLERASQTMSRIITDVVDVGRLGSPSVPLELGNLSVAAVIDEACEASAGLAESRKVQFDRSVDAGLSVTADRGRLGRALDLLISGAVTRTPANRAVVIKVARDADRVVWSVADGAPPLPADPVPSGPVAIRRRTGAFTWMVVRGVVRAHGGTVWLDETASAVTLYVALPLVVATGSSQGAGVN